MPRAAIFVKQTVNSDDESLKELQRLQRWGAELRKLTNWRLKIENGAFNLEQINACHEPLSEVGNKSRNQFVLDSFLKGLLRNRWKAKKMRI